MPGTSAEPAPVVHPPSLKPLEVLNAITDPMRYAVLRELADGSYPPVISLAKKLGCPPRPDGPPLAAHEEGGSDHTREPGRCGGSAGEVLPDPRSLPQQPAGRNAGAGLRLRGVAVHGVMERQASRRAAWEGDSETRFTLRGRAFVLLADSRDSSAGVSRLR